MGVKDYYRILGISISAKNEDIKKAYRRLAKNYHPDVHKSDDNTLAREKFDEITEAYNTLIDPKQRKKYDQMNSYTNGASSTYQPADAPAEDELNIDESFRKEATASTQWQRPREWQRGKSGRNWDKEFKAKRSAGGQKRETVEEPIVEPAWKHKKKPAGKSNNEPIVEFENNGSKDPADESFVKPAWKHKKKTVEHSNYEPVVELAEEQVNGPVEEPIVDAAWELVDETVDEPVEKPVKEPEEQAANRIVEFNVSFETAMKGGKQVETILLEEKCEKCKGTGAKSKKSAVVCPGCEGHGYLPGTDLPHMKGEKCPRCDGRGTLIKEACTRCRGSGRFRKDRKIVIHIPPAVQNGARFMLKELVKDEDLPEYDEIEAELKVSKHPFFRRNGLDIRCDAPITVQQAILGADISVRTPMGKRVVIKIPAGTDSGTTFRIDGHGIYKDGQRGHQLVTVKIITPKKLTPKAREQLDLFMREIDSKMR
jgi:DnaJ-class molecular chaperone